jgi:hypothetical protein
VTQRSARSQHWFLVLVLLLSSGPVPALAQDAEAAAADEPEFEGVAEVEAPPREPTQHTIAEEQLTTIAGTRGDALRSVEIMPGVSRTPFGSNPGPPLLRGSPSHESLVLIDGAQVPLLYHFGGLTSTFNSHLLESVTLYPGNYSARYGRAAGGAVEAQVRAPKSDRLHLVLELSAIDSFALAEGPLGSQTSLALAARRSNVDLFIDTLIDDDSTAVVAAPVYYDYQAVLSHRFNEQNELRAMLYGSSDAFELHFGEAANDDPSLRGEFGARDSFHRLQLSLTSRLSPLVEQKLMVSAGPAPGRGELGEIEYEYSSWELNGRAEWAIFAAPWLRVDTGLDVIALDTTFHYRGIAPGPGEGLPSQGTLASQETVDIDSSIEAIRPAAFVEASLEPTPGLLIIPGVRADYFSDGAAWTVDPRLGTRLAVGPTSTLKAGVGYYSQPPQYWEVMKGIGNPDVEPYRTLQSSAGVEQDFGEVVHADVEAFYKQWQDRVVSTPGGAPPRYVNGGTGDAYGLELLLDLRPTPATQVLAAYTLSRSTRQDRPNEPERFFDRDQTHNVSLTASYDLGSGWLAGARFRYVTGSPYSAVAGSVYDASSDTYRPLYAGLNETRYPAFHQLDLRIEKLWRVGPVDLTTYLEVMNVYNAKNQESRRYSFDYRESASVAGMPLFPNLGIRGAL